MTTADKYYDLLVARLSRARLDAYARRIPQPADKVDVLAYYLWNTALGQALYAPIQVLEVAIRNSLHTAASGIYGTDRWFDDPHGPRLEPWQRNAVADAVSRLTRLDRRRLQTPTPPPPATGRVIAELHFGFWVGLFNDQYDPAVHPLWRGNLLIKTFPAIPPDEPARTRNRRLYRNRRVLSVKLNRVLRLRNRISHHEPIWYWRDPPIANLGEQHNEILELLGWIEPVLRDTAALLDDFPAVYGHGPAPYRAKLDTFIATLNLP